MLAQVLLRWINHHIREFVKSNSQQQLVPTTFRVSNLHSDLADAAALAVLLHQVVPRSSVGWDLTHAAMDPSLSVEQRATQVCAAAKLSGVDTFEVVAEDITKPRSRLLLAFVAAIFHVLPGFKQAAAPEAAVQKRVVRGSPSQDREVRNSPIALCTKLPSTRLLP
jgi:hypothetical protein